MSHVPEHLLVQRKVVLVEGKDALSASTEEAQNMEVEVPYDANDFPKPSTKPHSGITHYISVYVMALTTVWQKWPVRMPSMLLQLRSRFVALVYPGSADATEGLRGIDLVGVLLLLAAFSFAAIGLAFFLLCRPVSVEFRREAGLDQCGSSSDAQEGCQNLNDAGASSLASLAGAFREREHTATLLSTPRAAKTRRHGMPLVPATMSNSSACTAVGVVKVGHEAGSPHSSPERILCPCLMVPKGKELVFVVCEAMTRGRQRTSFGITDVECKPLFQVIVDETQEQCGIYLQLLDNTPLAWVRTSMLYDESHAPIEICFPAGQVFCTIEHDQNIIDASRKGFQLHDPAGRLLVRIQADVGARTLKVFNVKGKLICFTERCAVSSDSRPHYRVRVAPRIDAGFVLCALLAVGKVEACELNEDDRLDARTSRPPVSLWPSAVS